jgi:hypothetical protein
MRLIDRIIRRQQTTNRFQLQLLHCWPGLGGKRPPDLLRVSRQFPDTARKRRSSMPPSSHVDGGLTDDYDLVVSDGWELEVEPPVPYRRFRFPPGYQKSCRAIQILWYAEAHLQGTDGH